MPNKENIRKWVDALRSGDHEQGTGALNEQGKKCCLGVACEVARQELPDLVVGQEYPGEDSERATYDGEGGYLPRSVIDWLGVDSHNPSLKWEGADGGYLSHTMTPVRPATYLNDSAKLSFGEIADVIEKTYLNE